MAIFFSVSFFASVIGAICGIGGGVVIKPVLDMLGLAGAGTISFLSGCTVLSMSCYSVGKSFLSKERSAELSTGTPLAIGAAVGGVAGKHLFDTVKALFENPNRVGAVQAVCLAVITIGALIYTVNKKKIRTHRLKNKIACMVIGLLLGVMSSFLGIGGGPINLVILYYFFGMETKAAAANSLYIILFSQAASLISTLATGTVPEFHLAWLVLMVAGGITGGIVGRAANKRLTEKTVEKLFVGLMVIIIAISTYNICRYTLH